MRKKFMASAAILALLMSSPQVKAEDDVVIFGGEFEDEANQSAPINELPPEESEPPAPSEESQESLPIQSEDDDNLGAKLIFDDLNNQPEQQPLEQSTEEIEKPAQIEPQGLIQSEEEDNLSDRPIFDDLNNLPEQQPLEQSTEEIAEPAQIEPQDLIQAEEEDNLGGKLIFDDLTNLPEQKPLEQPTPIIAEPPQPETVPLSSMEYEQPFEQPTEISNEWQERVEEPTAIVPPPVPVATVEPIEERPARRYFPSQQTQPQTELKMLKPRFIKLAVDDTYTYYLDKNAVEWKKLPYSSSEYMADVWIRMVERKPKELDSDMANYGAENFQAQINLAREQGYQYPPEDIKVLSRQDYILEHYYLRPKTRQVQFLCELEVFGRPQNTINERAYDYKNWENLVPGSVESMIYETAIKVLGKSKGSERGHMTFIDMLEEYGRISLR